MNDQSKLILSAYRPGGQDANDPAFALPLAQAERDPHLREWLGESQSFDRAVSDRLRSVPVPSDLRATILAGGKLSRPGSWWNRPKFWAVAAVLAVLAALPAILMNGPSLAPWQTRSLAVLTGIEKGTQQLDEEHRQATHLVEWLTAHAAPAPSVLPAAVATTATFGCKRIDADGRQVSLICFDLGHDEAAHLFTTARKYSSDEPPEGRAVFVKHDGWNTASWSAGSQVFMFASNIPADRLKLLLPSAILARPASAPGVPTTLAVIP